jgi:tetratricopeptide (TPR) repeat protein
MLFHVGELACHQGKHDLARASYGEALKMVREVGDKELSAYLISRLASLAFEQRDVTAARRLYEDALTMFEEIGAQKHRANVLLQLGHVARWQMDYPAARLFYEQCLAISQEIGMKPGAVIGALGTLAADEGNDAEARRSWAASLAEIKGSGKRDGLAASLEGFAYLAHKQGHAARAAQLLGAAKSLTDLDSFSGFVWSSWQAEKGVKEANWERTSTEVRTTLGEEAFDFAWTEGSTMTVDRAIALALEEGDS